MAQTLIIKNADFSTNKVTTVTFGDIPCTGILFSESTVTITGYDPTEIEYTLTPSNTTDAVSWSSSDTNVVSVSGGVMTIVGIGSCSVTATCGNYSDTVAVTVSISYIPAYAGACTTTINTQLEPNIVQAGSNTSRFTAYGSGAQESEYVSAHASGWSTSLPAIKLPKNTARVRITTTSQTLFYNGDYSAVVWAKDESCGNTNYPDVIKPISDDVFNIKSSASNTFNVPSGADSMYVRVRITGDTPQDWDSAIEGSGFSIEFLLAETT